MPATVQAPSQAAIRRKVVWLAKPSRVPSEHPTFGSHSPLELQYSVAAQSASCVQATHWFPRQVSPPVQSASVQQWPVTHATPQHTCPLPQAAPAPHGVHWFPTQIEVPQSSDVQQSPVAQAPPQQTCPAPQAFWALQATHWFATHTWPPVQSASAQQLPAAHAPPQQTWPSPQGAPGPQAVHWFAWQT